MTKIRLIFALPIALGLVSILLPVDKAEAIPAFARRYKTECSTCHTIFPERNQFGDAFKKNSYVWPGKSAEQKQEKVLPATDQEKKDESFWSMVIPEMVPLAFWVQHDIILNKDKKPTLDMNGETEFEIFTGGSFRDKAGFWAEYNFAPEKELGEAYIQFRNPLGLPFNIKGGKLKPRLSIWKSNDSATLNAYGFNDMLVGNNPFAINREQGGVEVNSVIGSQVFVATGIVTPPEKDRNGPEWYGHASVRFGGTDFLGNAPTIDLNKENILDDLSLTLGSFGYVGSSNSAANDFYRVGLESEVLFKGLTVRLNGIFGKDNDPLGLGQSEKSLFLMGQAQYLILRNVLAAMRFEYQDIQHEGISRRYIPTVTFAPWQNIRLALEYMHETNTKDNGDPTTINREARMRVSFAF